MSSKISTNRTIDGADIIEADTINIFEKLEIDGQTGNPKQIVRLKADGSSNIEYSNLEALTFTGSTSQVYNGIDARTINIPSALTSAGNPLVINSNVISFNGLCDTLTATGTGSIFADLQITGNLDMDGNIEGDGATDITGIKDISSATLTTSGNIVANGNIVGDGATDITSIKDISSATLTTSGNIVSNGNFVGDGTTDINNINGIAFHSATPTPSPDFVGIDTEGRGIYTRGGNINLHHGTTFGQLERVGSITGKPDPDKYSFTSGASIDEFGDITSRRFTGDSLLINDMTDTSVGTNKITISGAGNSIVGDGSTTISSMASLHCSTINNSTTNSANINVSADLDVDGVITGTDTAIFTGGFKQAGGGGNFSMSNSGNLGVSGNITATSGNITAIGSGSILNGLQTTGNIDMDNNDITNVDNINCATITLGGEISAGNIPSSISGTKTFTGTITTNGNTTLCKTSGDLIIGDINQTLHSRPVATLMSSLYQKFNIQSNLVGNEAISGRLEYQKNKRIEQRSYHHPYQLSDYFLPNTPSTTYLYDHTDTLTGDTNRTPYRVIKIHPQNWTPNDDSSSNDLAIHDANSFATTGNTTYGGLKAKHSAIIECWTYIDIPEGLKFKAIFLRIASSTTGSSFVARNVKVFKRHLGQLSTDAQYSVKIADGSTATSGNTPVYALTSNIDQQDLLNEYDNYMAIRCELNNTSYVLMGGYVICEPVNIGQLAYSLDITSGSSHSSNFTITIKDLLYPNTTLASKEFTAKNQTKTFIIGYTYASTRNFIIQFGQTDDGFNYSYSLTCNKCLVEGSTSPTIDDVVSNSLILIRQTPTISFSQIPS